MKKILILVLSLALCFAIAGCGSNQASDTGDNTNTTESQQEEESSKEADAIENWPSDNGLVKEIPACTTGSIKTVTGEPHSVFILVSDVDREAALDYWAIAQDEGFTDMVSESETDSTGGFTYVANNEDGLSLTVTWAPDSGEGNLSILAIQP